MPLIKIVWRIRDLQRIKLSSRRTDMRLDRDRSWISEEREDMKLNNHSSKKDSKSARGYPEEMVSTRANVEPSLDSLIVKLEFKRYAGISSIEQIML